MEEIKKDELTDDNIKTTLCVEYDKYKTKLTKKYLNRKPYVKPDPKKVYSFIPGTVKKIMVTEGSKIKKGSVLLHMDAMKMTNQIMSPMDGVIKNVYVKTGDLITFKQLLVEFV